jgi:hypothetical protein
MRRAAASGEARDGEPLPRISSYAGGEQGPSGTTLAVLIRTLPSAGGIADSAHNSEIVTVSR